LLSLPLEDAKQVPAASKRADLIADLIADPVSSGQDKARKTNGYPKQDLEATQLAFVSYKSCGRLMGALWGIICIPR
jgi:hypothetical protein